MELGPHEVDKLPSRTGPANSDGSVSSDAGSVVVVHDAATTPPTADDAACGTVAPDAGTPDDHDHDGDAGDEHGGTDAGAHDASVAEASPPSLPVVIADGTFATVFTVLTASCVGCHGAGKPLDMSTPATAYATLVNVPASMKACGSTDGGVVWTRIVPGDLDNSLLIQKVEGHAPCGNPMPIKGLLPDVLAEVFRAWVVAGAPAPLTDILPLPLPLP